MGKQRPDERDRWQNRVNDRVAEVKSVYSNAAGEWVEYCYEQRTPNARSTRKQVVGMREFLRSFSLYEAAS